MRKKVKGFTIIEILTVLAIMAILIGVLLPALNMARNAARVAKQKVQFTAIDQALLAWRNDFGDYPPSSCDLTNPSLFFYCGAQKLAESLLGWDLLGFHPSSVWRADGKDVAGTNQVYNPADLTKRKSRYLEIETANAFRLMDLFTDPFKFSAISFNRFVLCDSFGRTDVVVGKETVKAGRPILYYRADPSQQQFAMSPNTIYNYLDNLPIVMIAQINDNIQHPLINPQSYFYNENYKIMDQKVFKSTGKPWPHRPDSFILISAGIDGIYGTQDDITNFGQ